jgi:hypothetical protein
MIKIFYPVLNLKGVGLLFLSSLWQRLLINDIYGLRLSV